MRVCFRSRWSVVVMTAVGVALVGGFWAQAAPAVTIEQPVTAKMVIMTQPGANGGCHGSIFAVVPDLPDAAVYRVTLHRTDGNLSGVVEFNRHERGSLQVYELPEVEPGTGEIAGLLISGERTARVTIAPTSAPTTQRGSRSPPPRLSGTRRTSQRRRQPHTRSDRSRRCRQTTGSAARTAAPPTSGSPSRS